MDSDKKIALANDSQNTAQDSKDDGIALAKANPSESESERKKVNPSESESEMKKVNPSAQSNPSSSGQSIGRLVYVRRRAELDSAKATTNKPTESASPSSSHKLVDWEERYHHLQMLLNKLNDSSHQTDHVQMLWSLSSAELSKHAVDLEKRSIQFSLEEAREMQRVASLNVLGRSLKSTSNDGE